MIKKQDMMIIYHLRKNARETLTSMSRKTKIPISTIYEKLRMNEGKIILKHTSLVNFAYLGYKARAKIILKSKRDTRSELKNYLLSYENINSLYRINNGYDYLVECIFKDMKELEEFIERVDEKYGLEKKDVYYIIDDLKREAFLSESFMYPVSG